MPTPQPELMQCMEIWGGNESVEKAVSMAGLDAWVYSKAYGESAGGGDVYYVSSCAAGMITRLLIADVSGHGAAVCDTAGVLRSLMRLYVNFIDQKRFVKSMNAQFTTLSAAGCFATAIVTTFVAPGNHVSLCNAGHPPPLLYRAATNEWSFLEQQETADSENASNIPLGILDVSDYEQFEVPLAPGDQIVCYTDSLIESRDAEGELLGTQGLLDVVRRVGATEPGLFIPALLAAVRDIAPGNLDGDDVTLLLFRPNPRTARVPFLQRACAPLRVVGGLLRYLAGRGEAVGFPEFRLLPRSARRNSHSELAADERGSRRGKGTRKNAEGRGSITGSTTAFDMADSRVP